MALLLASSTAGNAQAQTFQLAGRVSNASGAGIQNAEIKILDPGVVASTFTGAGGDYLTAAPAGTYDIQVIPPANSGFQGSTIFSFALDRDRTLDFVLVTAEAVVLSGTVTDQDGDPAGNQRIRLQAGVTLDRTTDNQGAFSFAVSPGTYDMRLFASGSPNPDIPQRFDVTARGISVSDDLVLDLSLPEVQLTVAVVDPGGVPVADAAVRVECAATNFVISGLQFSGGVCGQNHTDSGGEAAISLFPATFRLTVTPPPSSGLGPIVVQNVAVTSDTTQLVTLMSPVHLSGTVTDQDGDPATNQRLRLQGGVTLDTVTDSEGAYSFLVNPGTYDLRMFASGSPNPDIPRQFDVTARGLSFSSDTTLDLALPDTQLTVVALDPEGAPVADAFVRAECATVSGLQFRGGVCGQSNTDADGQAVISLFPATFRVTVTPPAGSGLGPSVVSGLLVETDISQVVELMAPLIVGGTITDSDGDPAGNQRIRLQGGVILDTTTDSQGAYSFEVGPGTYDMRLFASGSSNPDIPRQFDVTARGVAISDTDGDGLGDACDVDDDGDGLRDEVDLQPLTPMTCSGNQFSCENNVFSDASSGGATEGEIRNKLPEVVLTVLDEPPNAAKGIRVIAVSETPGAGAKIKLPKAGFLVDGQPQSGAVYNFETPANFVITKTGSALLEVVEGSVQIDFELLGVVVALEAGDGIHVEEDSFDSVELTSTQGTPMLSIADADTTIVFEGMDSGLRLFRDDSESPLEVTGVSGMLTVSVGDRMFSLEAGDMLVPGDLDEDGVPNAEDLCPEQPQAATTLSYTGELLIPAGADGFAAFTVSAVSESPSGPVLDQVVIFTPVGSAAVPESGCMSTTNFGGEASCNLSSIPPDVYRLEIVSDEVPGCFAASSDEPLVVVYDPDSPRATGGGYILPDAESTLPAGSDEDKAHFGFIVRINQNQAAAGNLEFQYRAADLKLKSAAMEWYTVSNNKAIFQGAGTINGTGNYTFRVQATDGDQMGQPDRFDIVIWEGTDTESAPFHRAKNDLAGGSIVVHRR